MKEIWKYIGKILFGLFVLGLLFWTANLTIHAIRTAVPGDPIAPIVGLVLFDFGAIAWMHTFLKGARGAPQRGTALFMTLADVAGVIYMAAGGLGKLSPVTVATGLVLATAANYIGWIMYKLTDPEARQDIQMQTVEDERWEADLNHKKELYNKAMQQTRAMLDRDGYKLAAVISKRNYISIKNSLNLDLTDAERKAWEKDAIDGEVKEIDPLELPAPATNTPGLGTMFGAWLKSFFGARANAFMNLNSTSQPLPQSSNESDLDQEPSA